MKPQPSQPLDPRARALRLGLAAILIAGLALAPGCGSRPGHEAAVDDGGADGAAVAASKSDVAPDFQVTDLSGEKFNFSETAGQVRLIDFWATWCAPCREEIPMLVELDRAYGDKGLTILGISDESAEVVRKFVGDKGVTYRNLIDDADVASNYMVLGLPTGFLIDRDGNIVERFVGPKPGKILEKRIRELLDLPPA